MTYLSIDLDFWQTQSDDFQTKSLNYLTNLTNNKFFCINHHAVLNDPNINKYNNIINLDYHSDICEDEENGDLPPLNCGTWANFIKDKGNKNFIWAHPGTDTGDDNDNSLGYCHAYFNPFLTKSSNYKSCRKKKVGSFWVLKKYLDQFDVRAISICLSPDWGGNWAREWFYRMAGKYGIDDSN